MNGYCYQSIRWQYLRPLGSLQNAVRMLEKRNVDEIAIIRYCRENDNHNSLDSDLELIANIDCITPLSFGGGIRDLPTLEKLHNLPIERLLLNSAYIDKNQALIEEAIRMFGKQALIAVLPYKASGGELQYFNSSLNLFQHCDIDFVDSFSNEVMFYNIQSEGINSRAPITTYNFPLANSKIIISGGINRTSVNRLHDHDFAAVCMDNVSLHHEFNFNQL